MSDKPLKIEELLEQVGASVEPDDVSHRYELRRTLLCSRYFDAACHRDEQRNRFLAYTAPLFAGTVLVVVFAVAGTAMIDADLSYEPHPTIDTSRMISAEHLSQITYVAVSQPSVRVDAADFIDTEHPPVPLPDSLRFVPMDPSPIYSVQ